MGASKVQLIGGSFQDGQGNPITNGYLRLILSQDGTITGVGNICSGIEVTIQLDANGSVVTSTPQYVWGNDVIVPNTYYIVTGYSIDGQACWGPNNQQVTGVGPFNCSQWVPNQITTLVGPYIRGSQIFSGSGIPGVIAGQQNGDWYINVLNGYMYQLIAGTWTFELNITGPPGP